MRFLKKLTLLELLFSFGVIAVVAIILFPVFSVAHECARNVACASSFKQVGTAADSYAEDYDGLYPGSGGDTVPLRKGRPALNAALIADNRARDWPALLFPYTKNEIMFYCRAEPFIGNCGNSITPEAKAKYASSYTLNGWTSFGLRKDAIRNPSRFILLAERNTAGLDPNASYLLSWWNWQQSAEGFAWPPTAQPIPTAQAAHDLAVTRHQGMSNYVFADGHVKTLPFAEAWASGSPTAFWPESQ